ncbi:MAG: TetR/AcrR family transcriptional regulator [Nocardioidaceae bacterium]
MARPREFDTTEVLDRAVDVFWRQGYEATSIADLTESLGIARASLYGAFGSKHDLYVRALQHYVETRHSAVDLLSRPGPVLPAIRAVLESAVTSRAPGESQRGCLITNASAECEATDWGVRRWVDSSWVELETALTSALLRARAEGELGPQAEPRGQARMLVVLLQGLRVIDRSGCDNGRCSDAIDTAMSALA